MVSKIKSFAFLSKIFDTVPNDVLYLISKFCGRYIHLPKIEHNIFKTKMRKEKYCTKHLIIKTKHRRWSI